MTFVGEDVSTMERVVRRVERGEGRMEEVYVGFLRAKEESNEEELATEKQGEARPDG